MRNRVRQGTLMMCAMALSMTSIGCTGAGMFTGQGSIAPKKVQPPAPVPISCVQAALRSIRVLSGVIDQTRRPRSVDLELTFEPCPSQPQPVELPVAFDMDGDWTLADGSRPAHGTPVPLTMVVDNVQPVLTRLVLTRGSDLFGHSGANYFALMSDQPIRVSPATRRAVMTIDMTSLVLATRGQRPVGTFQMPLFLRIGDAKAVTTVLSVTGTVR